MSESTTSILDFPGLHFIFVEPITLGLSLARENFRLRRKKWMDHGSPFLQGLSSYPVRQLNYIWYWEHFSKDVNPAYLRKIADS